MNLHFKILLFICLLAVLTTLNAYDDIDMNKSTMIRKRFWGSFNYFKKEDQQRQPPSKHQSSTNDVNVMFSDVCKSLISLYSNREQQKPTQKQIDHFRYLYNAWLEVENKKKKAEFMWSLRQG
jgi:hypothetical protein